MLKTLISISIFSSSLIPLCAASEAEPTNEVITVVSESAVDGTEGQTNAAVEAATSAAETPSLLDSIVAVQSTFHSADGSVIYTIIYTKDKERDPDTYQAKLSVEVPNKYRFALKKDDQIEHFISDGKIEWHVEDIAGEKFASKTELKENSKGKFAAVTDFIPLRLDTLRKHFHLAASPVAADSDIENAVNQLELKPITADQQDHMKWTKIYFDKDAKACRIQILDANGNLYDISVTKMEYNKELSSDLFTYSEEE